MKRLKRIRRDFRTNRFLHREYPDYSYALAPTHLRSYYCTLTGGHKWGEPFQDDAFDCLAVKCRKCRSTWANYGRTA